MNESSINEKLSFKITSPANLELSKAIKSLEVLQRKITIELSPSFKKINAFYNADLKKRQEETSKILSEYQSQLLESFLQTNTLIKNNFSANIHPVLNEFRDYQENLYKSLSKLSYLHLTFSASNIEKIESAYSSIIDVNQEMHLNDSTNVQDIKESIKKKTLTWEQVLVILAFVFQLLEFTLARFPDKDAIEIKNLLTELIVIESQQLELMIDENSID